MSEVPSIINYSRPLDEAEAPKPLPKGKYRGVIREVKVKTSAKGNTYPEILFFIGPDQYPADYTEGNPQGMTLAHRRLSLEDNPNARWSMRQFCETIGAPLGGQLNLDDWLHREALLEVDHEEYEGQQRPVIRRVLAA